MNVFHRVAQRSMRANRMRTIVTIIGVILSAAMFTAVTTFATTLLTHLQRVTAYLDGAYYLGVHNVDADTLASMRADSDIEAFSAAEVLGYAEVTVNNAYKPYLYVEPPKPEADPRLQNALPLDVAARQQHRLPAG